MIKKITFFQNYSVTAVTAVTSLLVNFSKVILPFPVREFIGKCRHAVTLARQNRG